MRCNRYVVPIAEPGSLSALEQFALSAKPPYSRRVALPGRESAGTNIEPSVIQRVVSGLKYMVTGVGPDNFFGPAQPLQPLAQDRSEGRGFDYPVGYNLRIRPREGEPIGFPELRALADGYDLLRLVIETRKDQIEAYDWEIVPTDPKKSADTMTKVISNVSSFLTYPDKEHNWSQWLRMQVEDLLVLDAVAIYPRASRGGQLYALELVDPGTIKRVLDVTGRTPEPPDVAYQQIIKGIPASDYSRDALCYTMRNPRTNRIYGFGPVEQVMMTVNIAVRRQLTQLGFYTEGNVPEAIAQVPDSWTADQTKQFQLWWDSIIEGQSGAKRRMTFVPSLKDIVFPRQNVLKDEYDEWLARIICFAFSISPSALIKQVNRASGEQMADTAKEEGLLPLLRFLESHITGLIQKYLGHPELRFAFKIVNKVDPASQAKIHQIYIDTEVMTPDEVRDDLDLDAMTPQQREKAWPSSATPVSPMPGMNPDGTKQLPMTGTPQAPGAQPASQVEGGQAGGDKTAPQKPPAEPTQAEKLLSLVLPMLDPARLAEAVSAINKSAPAQVIELQPHVDVNVGDTNVHVPVQRAAPAPAPEPEPEPESDRMSKRFVGRRMADGTLAGAWEDRLQLVSKREPDGSLSANWESKP